MNVALPEAIERQFTPDEIRLRLALGLFLDSQVTLGQGAAVAGLPQTEFLHELGKRKIPVHYDEADLLADIATVGRWTR